MKTHNVREVALTTLLTIEKQQAYSQLLLNNMLNKYQLNEKDIPLLTQLVYGVTQRKLTLDFYLAPFIKKNKNKMQDWVLILLRMSLYQMVYLDKIPDHAILNEAVNIAKKKGHKGIVGFVNAVLRNIQRSELPNPKLISNPIKRLSVEYSCPEWLVRRWVASFGEEITADICETNNTPPLVTARCNVLSTTRDELIQQLEEEGVKANPGQLSLQSVIITKGILPKTEAFKSGKVSIQDESSMLVAEALGPNEKASVLDACAGPGGKATHLGEKLQNTGQVIALDLHEHKTRLIDQQAARLGLTNIKTKVLDSRKCGAVFEKESFDYILVDAPCTGFGVIRRKPDIKWSKTEKDVMTISLIQRDILNAVAPLLKKGGRLVYSTCTIETSENNDVVQDFLISHPNFKIDDSLKNRLPSQVIDKCRQSDGTIQVLPHHFQTDGFYIASLIRE